MICWYGEYLSEQVSATDLSYLVISFIGKNPPGKANSSYHFLLLWQHVLPRHYETK